MKAKNKITLDQFKDKHYGIKGTNTRDELDSGYENFKLGTLQERKDFIIQRIQDNIRTDISKYTFIKLIVDDELKINKRKKVDIVKDLVPHEKIIKRDGNYDYLLNMSIGSLTVERMEKLLADIKVKNVELGAVKAETVEQMWIKDLK